MNSSITLPKAFWVTGTDTDVGKTFISAVLTIGLQAHYWKPIGAGQSDREWIQSKTALPNEYFFPENYLLKTPVSPHLAAQIDGIEIDIKPIEIPRERNWKYLVIEGAGGIMVPINSSLLMIDLIKQLNVPAIVVARSTLGTINHTVLTVEKLREKNIPVAGVIMNGPKNASNRQAIEKYGQVSVIAEIEPVDQINPGILKQIFVQQFKASLVSVQPTY